VRQAQLGASYRVPYPCIKVGSPNRRESWGRSSDYKLLALGFSFGEIAGYQNRLSVWRLSCEEKMLKRKLHAL
jgi:hypothetical protein